MQAILPSYRAGELDAAGEADFALAVAGVGRFRVNVHRQRGTYALVARRVPSSLPGFDALGLPPQVPRLVEEPDGLVIVAGPAGSGRSTTAALLIDHLNRTRHASILTVEDPIEYLHADVCSIVTQREVGADTPSYADAMRRVTRHDADVVFVGELVDTPTAHAVVAAAGRGQLVITTMAATSAAGALAQLVELLDGLPLRAARRILAGCLRGVVCQRLVARRDGRGRVAAVEVLVNVPKVAQLVADADGDLGSLVEVIAEGTYHGMQTIDQSLEDLVRRRLVAADRALMAAADPDELRLSLTRSGIAA